MFNANDAFRGLDMNRTGLVTKEEIRLFLETKSIFLSCLEVESVARRYD